MAHRIGIDARIYGSKQGGIGRYVQELVHALPRVDRTNTYVLFLSPKDFVDFSSSSTRIEKVCVDARPYMLAEQLHMAVAAARANIDLLHVPHFNVPYFWRGPLVVTIHDLIEYKYPRPNFSSLHPLFFSQAPDFPKSEAIGWKSQCREAFGRVVSEAIGGKNPRPEQCEGQPSLIYRAKHRAFRALIRACVSHASAIITLSRYGQQDIMRTFGRGVSRIVRIPHGVSALGAHSARAKNRGEASYPYILYVGSAAPHKNVERLLRAYRMCVEQDRILEHLLLVMPDDFHTARIRRFLAQSPRIVRERVHFMHALEENDLRACIAQARLLVSSSQEEGYGLPFAEAHGAGTPVLAGFVGALPELPQQRVRYWNTRHIPSMRIRLLETLHDSTLHAAVSVPQQKLRSWQDAARDHKNLYNAVLGKE